MEYQSLSVFTVEMMVGNFTLAMDASAVLVIQLLAFNSTMWHQLARASALLTLNILHLPIRDIPCELHSTLHLWQHPVIL